MGRALHDLLGVSITPQLQVRVDHVVHRVDGRVGVGFGVRGPAVGGNRFFPVAQPCEDVRGHVQRVRRRRRDVGIAARGRKTVLATLGESKAS